MTKAELRKYYQQQRMRLSEAQWLSHCHAILQQFMQLDFSRVQILHAYLPLVEKKEVDTLLLIDWLRRYRPQVQIAVPKADFTQFSLSHFVLEPASLLQKNKMGILEPAEGAGVAPEQIDMVLVPLLAFDRQGYRVGYGKGFYDRFLATCRPDVNAVGLSFFPPVDLIEDRTAFDFPLRKCITPEKIYEF